MHSLSHLKASSRVVAVASAILAGGLGLSACVVTPVGPPVAAEVVGPRFVTPEVIPVQPPPPREEIIGVAPQVGFIWAPGYWNWEGGRHVWVGGRWIPPRAGYYWEPHTWVHVGNGWHLREGYWARR